MDASGAPRRTGREAIMGTSAEVVLALTAIAFGLLIGGFLAVSFAIRRDDSDLGSIRYDAPSHRARTVRHLVGISASRWE
jgi:hypothetical protein